MHKKHKHHGYSKDRAENVKVRWDSLAVYRSMKKFRGNMKKSDSGSIQGHFFIVYLKTNRRLLLRNSYLLFRVFGPAPITTSSFLWRKNKWRELFSGSMIWADIFRNLLKYQCKNPALVTDFSTSLENRRKLLFSETDSVCPFSSTFEDF